MALDLSLYKMSKDYGQLKELLDQGKSVLVKRRGDIWLLHRVDARFRRDLEAVYCFSGGGLSCSPGLCNEHFKEACEDLELEFLPPTA